MVFEQGTYDNGQSDHHSISTPSVCLSTRFRMLDKVALISDCQNGIQRLYLSRQRNEIRFALPISGKGGSAQQQSMVNLRPSGESD